ncbi:MAG TPA: nitroreductase family deazaflavin-dependent oxidoreductase [Polyangiales bacterium]|jgi:deazaflavin-dependent oxidoreductase (nitroreductase family)|nr:nitroreductase family deazaflavin-dependent oxidoreductase [Polyangiales bacterium]
MAQKQMPAGFKFFMSTRLGKIMQDANTWLYRRTGGKVGGKMQGAPVLLLTTRGRKTGKQRTTPLIYLEDAPQLAVVASKGGWPQDPLWYQNLQADPAVEVQQGPDVKAMTARTATPEEREKLWPRLVKSYAAYDDYQSWSDRKIPVVILSPRS